MRAHHSSLLLAFAIIVGLAFSLMGCGDKQPTDQAQAPPDASPGGDKADPAEGPAPAGPESGGDEMPPPGPPGADSIAELRKTLSSEDQDEALGSIQMLQRFLVGDDAGLATDAAQILVETFQTSEDSRIRSACINALSVAGDAFMELFLAATEDESDAVLSAGIAALSRCPQGSRAQTRLEELVKSVDEDVETLASQALEALKEGSTNEITSEVAKLGNPNDDLSAQAAIALKLMGKKALPTLERAIRTSTNPRQRHAATMITGMICAGVNPTQKKFAEAAKSVKKDRGIKVPPEANLDGLPVLIYALKDTDAMTREIAAQSLGYLGSEKAAGPLAKALRDEDVHVRRRAAAALITTPAASVERQITKAALEDEDSGVRRFAVEALGWIGSPQIVTALIKASRDDSADVRRYAAVQLGRSGGPAALDALVELYRNARQRERDADAEIERSAEQDVRWAAVQAVAGLRDRQSTDMLVEALEDPVPQVANAAESGLQKLGIAKRRLPGVDKAH